MIKYTVAFTAIAFIISINEHINILQLLSNIVQKLKSNGIASNKK
uniref:Uncharacterized protein n=1 Tax=Anguilla anguilla TaxID=7936 RepID=A0A0E9SFF6_ANGAN